MHVVGELVVVEALGLDCLRQHLACRIAERHEPIAERIDFLLRRLGLVALEQLGKAGEIVAVGTKLSPMRARW